MITRKKACVLAASHLKLGVRELGRPVRDTSCEQPTPSSPAERGSGGQWGAVEVAGGDRAPTLAQVERHGEEWLGLRAPQAKR